MDKETAIPHARIASNDGWNEIVFYLKKRFLKDQSSLILSTLIVKGNYWDVEKTLLPKPSLELSNEFVIELSHILLSEEKLRVLANHLEAWLDKPYQFELDISENRENQIKIFVGPREDYISTQDRPVFSLKYISSRMKGEWSFVTDQSCLNILLEGVTGFL